MSYGSFGVNDAFAGKAWSKILSVAARQYTPIAPLMGKGPNNIIQIKNELVNNFGDQITFGLRARLQGDGFTEGETAEGNGEALSIYQDKVTVNELGHVVGVRSQNAIDQQRVPFDLRDEAKDGLTEWYGDRWSKIFFNQVCGYTAETRMKFVGNNTVTAPSTNRRLWAAAQTADESLNSGHTFTLDLVDKAKELAMIGDDTQRVNPLRIGGEDVYVMYLHPKQVTALRTNASTGQWLDIQKAAMAGMQSSKSPIFTGALGMYNKVILREGQDVTYGVNSSTGAVLTSVRRAVLLGAQACCCAWGRKGGNPQKYRWSEKLLDHDRKLEVGAWTIQGFKKSRFNSQDFGTVVVSSYVL